MWHSMVGDMTFNSGLKRLSGVGNIVDVVCPHPSIRREVVVVMWGPSKGSDVIWLLGVSDITNVICPHFSMKGGVVVVTWWT